MVLLLVFASEVSLHFFVPAKHLNHIELAVLVSVYVGGFTRQLIDLIKSFIIYHSPPFCHNIKKNILKRFRCKNDKRRHLLECKTQRNFLLKIQNKDYKLECRK